MKTSRNLLVLFFSLTISFTSCEVDDINEESQEQNDQNSNDNNQNNNNDTFDPDEFWHGKWKPTTPNSNGPIIYTITPNTDRGYFRNTDFGNWQSVANAGFIQHSSLKWTNMVMINNTTWVCNTLWVRWSGQPGNSTPLEVAYAPATITITANTESTKSISVESIDPWGTTSEVAKYIRQPYD
jgi:hypothetical protein